MHACRLINVNKIYTDPPTTTASWHYSKSILLHPIKNVDRFNVSGFFCRHGFEWSHLALCSRPLEFIQDREETSLALLKKDAFRKQLYLEDCKVT